MMYPNGSRVFKILMLLGLGFVSGWSDDQARAARAIVDKWQNTVITVKIVSEQFEYESKVEAFGTIIDSSGLAVLSLSRADPSTISNWGVNSESKIKDLKMIMADGIEVPAKIVLRDEDLDLIFIKPIEAQDKKFPAVRLADNTKVEMLDEILILTRLDENAGYVPSASIRRVHSIIMKPRTLYVSDYINVLSGLGSPAFSLDGRVIGILLLKVAKSENLNTDMFGEFGRMMPVILPAAEIIEVVEKIP